MESYSRIRSIKLKRPTPEHPFGFSVRGGHEHGTGIFVSFVDTRSLAYRQGLKVGDQILRVNGYPVSAAVHHECLSLMRTRTSLHLKVRSVGMLPVKEKTGDPLTWKLVEEQPCPPLLSSEDLTNDDGHGNNRQSQVNSRMSDTSSQPDSRTEFHGNEAKIFIDTTGQSGLGCCICKGPPERPGIFVQSTKSNGVAREAGLRPGDQVLACNGHSFLHIPFAEAVYYLKQSKHLNLIVLKGAASDLFPGESSGYNSSASSLNGDIHASSGSNAPSESSASISTTGPGDIIVHENDQASKRLSMVTEENGIRDDEGSSGKRSIALDKNMEWDEVEQAWHKAEKETIVIEVRGEDPQGRIRSEEERLAEERRKLEEEQRRLVEEAQRLEEEKRKFEEEKRRTLQKSPSLVSSSSSSAESASSLAGALNQEILKRNERRENNPQPKEDERPRPGTVEQKKSIFSTAIDQEKRQQHEQLIEEFKRAHRKMFAHTLEENKDGGIPGESEAQRNRRIQKEIDHERNMVAQRVAGIVRQRQLRIERQHQECAETEREVSKHVIRNKSPPPPPPLPPSSFLDVAKDPPAAKKPEKSVTFHQTAISPTPKGQPKPLLQKSQLPSSTMNQIPPFTAKTVIIEERNGHSSPSVEESSKRPTYSNKSPTPPQQQQHSPQQQESVVQEHEANSPVAEVRPESPSPDYSNSPSPSPSPPRIRSPPVGMGGVDMESLESFRLKNPPKNVQKPPPFYFNEAAMNAAKAQGTAPNLSHYTVNGGMDDKKVRMAAYPSAYARPEPSRLGFLGGNGKGPAPVAPVPNGVKAEVILHRELEDALSRCNLASCNNANSRDSSNAKMMMMMSNGVVHHNQCQNQNGAQNGANYCNGKCTSNGNKTANQANGKPNGGILKMSNGGSSSSNKTISFGGRY